MARQLRIEYPGAFYHVFSRGNQKQPVFHSDEDRNYFLHCLRRTCEKFGAVIHVYCLMLNHFHLFLETPLGNLSRLMHYLITGYTVYFNRKHERQGHLFQGRYKSVLVDAVGYAKELSRYIHLNPVRSEIVDKPERYVWSSYGYYRGVASPEKWLETTVVLRLFGDQMAAARRAYVDFVNRGIGMDPPAEIRDSVRTGILGSEEFIQRIKKKYLGEDLKRRDREKPQLRKLVAKPELSQVLAVSERVLGPRNKHLIPMVILVSYKNSEYRLRELGEFFSLSISGTSNACKRAQVAVLGNSALLRAMEEIEREIKGK